MHPTRRAALGAALSLALLLGACSSSGDDDAAEETTTTEAEETTSTEAEVDEEALERISDVVLTLEDLPEGWEFQAEAAPDDSDGSPCLEGAEGEIARVRSDEFALNGEESTVFLATDAKVFADAAAAEAALEPFSDDEVLACVTDEFTEAAPAEVTGSFVQDDAITAEDLGVDQVEGVSGEFLEVTTSGAETPIYSAFLLIRSGDVAVQVQVFAIGGEPDLASLNPAITAVAERVAAA
jgi:hypothetical protein